MALKIHHTHGSYRLGGIVLELVCDISGFGGLGLLMVFRM